MLFAGIGILIGFILLVIPGFILLAAWSLSIPAIVIENKTPIEAMKRSFSLTKGRRFRIFIVLLLVGLIAYIIIIVINFPIAILAAMLVLKNHRSIPIALTIISMIASFIGSCLVTPISTIAVSLIYYDQRVRKEGFDLQFMMSSLKSGPNTETAPTIP
jgi:membrane-anchored glycerophosphoryl diester phosphodiesterase (GDPDase)